jgi:hypothetical protein
MPKKQYPVQLVVSPHELPVQTAGNLTLRIGSFRTAHKVALAVHSRLIESEPCKVFEFDFLRNKFKLFELNGSRYEIELIDIGKLARQDASYPVFSFVVREF